MVAQVHKSGAVLAAWTKRYGQDYMEKTTLPSSRRLVYLRAQEAGVTVQWQGVWPLDRTAGQGYTGYWTWLAIGLGDIGVVHVSKTDNGMRH